VCPKIRSPSRLPNYANLGPLACHRIENIEGVRAALDARDYLLTGPDPTRARIPDMGDVLV